jgi:hypothetical protein
LLALGAVLRSGWGVVHEKGSPVRGEKKLWPRRKHSGTQAGRQTGGQTRKRTWRQVGTKSGTKVKYKVKSERPIGKQNGWQNGRLDIGPTKVQNTV